MATAPLTLPDTDRDAETDRMFAVRLMGSLVANGAEHETTGKLVVVIRGERAVWFWQKQPLMVSTDPAFVALSRWVLDRLAGLPVPANEAVEHVFEGLVAILG